MPRNSRQQQLYKAVSFLCKEFIRDVQWAASDFAAIVVAPLKGTRRVVVPRTSESGAAGSAAPCPTSPAMPASTAEVKACSTPGCDRPKFCRGMCQRCYGRDYWKRRREGKPAPASTEPRKSPYHPGAIYNSGQPRAPSDGTEEAKPKKECQPPAEKPNKVRRTPNLDVKPEKPSTLSGKAWRAIDRTRIARFLNDEATAQDLPDPAYDALPAVVLGAPRRPQRSPLLDGDVDEAVDEENVAPEAAPQTSEADEEFSIVTATLP